MNYAEMIEDLRYMIVTFVALIGVGMFAQEINMIKFKEKTKKRIEELEKQIKNMSRE